MILNLYWAVGYTILAIPLVAGILYPYFMLIPAMGTILLSSPTVIVALNVQMLKRAIPSV